MKKAQLHPLEKERLKVLEKAELLDTLSEDEYDSIAKLASIICNTPIALISLIDEKRQWFKSRVGLDATETPRDIAFCAHAILENEVFIVENSHKDDRFRDNPLVLENPKVIFYAGAQILDPSSRLPLGTLCVIDHNPRSLTEDQKKSLQLLSSQVTKLIELRLQLKESRFLNNKFIQADTAVKNMQEGFVIQNQEGQIVDFNPAALQILGLTEDQILGRTSMDPSWQAIREDGSPFPGDEHPAMISLKTGQTLSQIKMGLKSNLFHEKWISINACPIFTDNNKKPSSVVTTFVDITELQQAQIKIVENARLVSVAEMSNRVSHEINNPLMIINGLCMKLNQILSQRKSLQDADLQTALSQVIKINETVFRISKIVKGLKTFTNQPDSQPLTKVSLNEIFSDALVICSEKFKLNNINLEMNLNEHDVVIAKFINLGQVLINLLNNSFDAVQNLNTKWIKIETHHKDDKIQIFITDSGQKILPEVASKMFLPLFTTKGIGQGTGLGLSTTKGLVEDMGGILYYNQNHPHTCFVIELNKAVEQNISKAG